MLPDRSILKRQKLAKVQKFKCDILGDFQTLCDCREFGSILNRFQVTLKLYLKCMCIIGCIKFSLVFPCRVAEEQGWQCPLPLSMLRASAMVSALSSLFPSDFRGQIHYGEEKLEREFRCSFVRMPLCR